MVKKMQKWAFLIPEISAFGILALLRTMKSRYKEYRADDVIVFTLIKFYYTKAH
jgi:hypothetical protein